MIIIFTPHSTTQSNTPTPAHPITTRAASRKFQTVQEIAMDAGATAQVMSREDIGGHS